MRDDYYVNIPRSEENIINLAAIIRQTSKRVGLWKFNMVSFIETILPEISLVSKITSKERKFKPIISFLPEDHPKKALVSFKPRLELSVKRSVWEAARKGDPEGTFILAHELGHMLMHSEVTMGFLATPELRQKHSIEHSAEWQADTFAKHFLLPDNILIGLLQYCNNNLEKISEQTSVPLYWVTDRVKAYQETGRRRERLQSTNFSNEHSFESNLMCPHCGLYSIPSHSPSGPCEECKEMVDSTSEIEL